jgi:TPR repeat protein
MRKTVLHLLEFAGAGLLLSACAGVGSVPPATVETSASLAPEPGNYAAVVLTPGWGLRTSAGPYECGPLGVYVDGNASYLDAMHEVLRRSLQHVTFLSVVLTPEQMKTQGFDAQVVINQGPAEASLVEPLKPGAGPARSDVALSATVAIHDRNGAVTQRAFAGHGRGKGEGIDCGKIVEAIGNAARTAIGSIARRSAAYIGDAIGERRVAVAKPASPPVQEVPPRPPMPVAKPASPPREAPSDTVKDTLRDAVTGGAAAVQEASAPAAEDDNKATVSTHTAAAAASPAAPQGDAAIVKAAPAADASDGAADAAAPKAEPVVASAPKAEPVVASAPKAETVALATPAAMPRPSAGPSPADKAVSAEDAFIRGANAAAGRGVPKSDAEALKWYRIAAAKGYAPAQNNLGFMYAEGRGVPRNDAEAVKWYKRAAAHKYPPAETSLGMMYSQGRGVKQSDFEALALYSSAANQGYGQAKANLAAAYGDGRGVERDIMTATFLLGSVREKPYTGSGIYIDPSVDPESYPGQ